MSSFQNDLESKIEALSEQQAKDILTEIIVCLHATASPESPYELACEVVAREFNLEDE